MGGISTKVSDLIKNGTVKTYASGMGGISTKVSDLIKNGTVKTYSSGASSTSKIADTSRITVGGGVVSKTTETDAVKTPIYSSYTYTYYVTQTYYSYVYTGYIGNENGGYLGALDSSIPRILYIGVGDTFDENIKVTFEYSINGTANSVVLGNITSLAGLEVDMPQAAYKYPWRLLLTSDVKTDNSFTDYITEIVLFDNSET